MAKCSGSKIGCGISVMPAPGGAGVSHASAQKFATVTNHGYIGYVVVVNKKFWDGLPADVRGELDKAMKEATAYGNGQSAKENEDALADIKKAGKTEIVTLTPEQDAAMRKAVEAGRDAFLAGRMPRKFYTASPSSPTEGVIGGASAAPKKAG